VCIVCISESDRSHISKTTRPNFTKFFIHVTGGRGSILIWRHCNALCTSGFVDDVMFAHNGPYGAWLIVRMLKVTRQGAEQGRTHIYACLVSYCLSTGGNKKWTLAGLLLPTMAWLLVFWHLHLLIRSFCCVHWNSSSSSYIIINIIIIIIFFFTF